MSDLSPRDWRIYVEDMIRFATKAQTYTRGLTQSLFVADEVVYDATLRNLELIGEAATRVPDAVRAAWPGIPWRQIIATRNRLIHGYLGIDDDTIWSILERDLPALLTELQSLKSAP
jgi:uncharacterized protein with HEPN domain